MREFVRFVPQADYCGCSGVVAGGGVVVGAIGVEPGSKYQTRSSASTTAAAMMSNLFVSMGFAHRSLCRTTLVPLETLDKSNHQAETHPPSVEVRGIKFTNGKRPG